MISPEGIHQFPDELLQTSRFQRQKGMLLHGASLKGIYIFMRKMLLHHNQPDIMQQSSGHIVLWQLLITGQIAEYTCALHVNKIFGVL